MPRRQSSAYLRPLTRTYPAGSRFERSIDALTRDSISDSLNLIQKALEDRFGAPTAPAAPSKAGTKPQKG